MEASRLASFLQRLTNDKAIHYRQRAELLETLQRLEYEAKTIREVPSTKDTRKVCATASLTGSGGACGWDQGP